MLVCSLEMECNKEEAVRAKTIAEKKMESKDFVGARKIAIRAQNLYPELENISQIICVCDVHCSAEAKNVGNEKDWYGILQVEQSADDVIIKKQYRKFALLLHPDKNKFPGAEAAFKFIGEAQRVLLDREKRSFYDGKYRRFGQSTAPNKPPQQNRNVTTGTGRQCWGQSNMNNATSNVNWAPNQEAYSKASNGWGPSLATCPSCRSQFYYYKDGNKLLQCQSCKKPFFAGDMNAQWIPPGNNPHQTATYTKVDISNQGVKISASNGSYQGNSDPQMPGGNSFAFPKSGLSKEVGGSKKTNEFNMNASKMNRGSSAASAPARKEIGKRGKKRVVEESSDSFESESSTDCEDAEIVKKSYATAEDDSNRRRSSRTKRHVSYTENGNDDEDIFNSGLKNESMDTTKSTSSAEINKANANDPVVEENIQESGEVDDGYDSDSILEDSPKTLEVPDPDFNDFDKFRKKECFKIGQIWAIYDTEDAMPRFYAKIIRVYASGFKLKINWFEPDPDDGDALLWVEKKLPYSCGKFSYGHTDVAEDDSMFSHLMFEKHVRGHINIYPKKQETWALFENWNRDWISNSENQVKFDYQFVEVLSEYDETVGIRVAILTKLEGFVCVFCRRCKDEIQIQPGELLRFSHRVPSFRLTGGERADVPSGSFELDPASVPLHLLQK